MLADEINSSADYSLKNDKTNNVFALKISHRWILFPFDLPANERAYSFFAMMHSKMMQTSFSI